MRNLYNMSIPVAKPTRISLTEQSSEKFRTTFRKVKTKDNASVDTIDLASIVIEDGSEDVKVVETDNESKDVIEVVTEQPEVIEDDIPNFVEFEDLKVVELREILDNKGVEYTATKKAELVELVRYS